MNRTLQHTFHRTLRSTRAHYARHTRSLLGNQVSSIVLLTVLFLYTNWCYQGLKRQVASQGHASGQQLSVSKTTTADADVIAAAAAAASAHAAGFLFSWGLDAQYRLGRMGGETAVPTVTLPQLKVVGAAASRHSLLLTDDGHVYSFGSNDSRGGGGYGSKALSTSGQLGRAGSWAPGPVLGALQGKTVKQVASGRYHSVAVTADGSVYTWGLNDWGQLGRPAPTSEPEHAAEVTVVSGAAAHSAASTAPAAGGPLQLPQLKKDDRLPRHGLHLLAVDGNGASTPGDSNLSVPGATSRSTANSSARSELASADIGSAAATPDSSSRSSACTDGWSCHAGSPGRVEALAELFIIAVAAGRYSTMALDSDGQLWVWGFDGCATAGQLPAQAEAWKPRKVPSDLMEHKRVVAFDVGYTFWLAATEDGSLFTCDTKDDGYAGTLPRQRQPNHAGQLGRSGAPFEPGRVQGALAFKAVVAVAAGREHAVVATADGQVFSFGGGRAVLGRDGPNDQPALVAGPELEGQFVRHVAAGEYFSLAATDRVVFGWGSNAFQCTGVGEGRDTEVLQPTAVTGRLGSGEWSIYSLAAGYQHAFATADRPGDQEAANMRDEALAAVSAAAAAASSDATSSTQMSQGLTIAAVGAAPVEVVLTRQQELQRKQAQKSAQQAAVAPTVDSAHQAAAHLASLEGHQKQQQHQVLQEQLTASMPTSGHAAGVTDLATSISGTVSNQYGLNRNINGGTSIADGISTSTNSRRSEASAGADCHWSYLASQQSHNHISVQQLWANWRPSPWRDQLKSLSADVFKLLPKEYNSMHKNPCWGGEGPQLACLPYFNIIGVSKCGTTDLYHRLTLYKQKVLPAANKGPHFWDECPYPPSGPCPAGPSGDFQAYINLFSMAADLIRSRPEAITGEASSNTFTAANGIYLRGFRGNQPLSLWAGSAGANATMPALLREAQPYLKLILMLRDPVSRYYSAFHYYRWWLNEEKPPTPEDFHNHALKEVQQWRECVAVSSVLTCVRQFTPQQLIKGMYSEFLQDWLQHWPRQQLLILRYEDYIAALPEHLKAVLAFLNLPEPDTATFAAMTGAEVQNKKAYLPMRNDTRQMLQSFYEPFNVALAQALKDDRWLWKE